MGIGKFASEKIHKNRGNRRKTAYQKAVRKQNLCHEMMHTDLYSNLGYYRKGKIHCSCMLCRSKTNGKFMPSCGGKTGGKNWSVSDLKHIRGMDDALREYV